MLICLLLSSPRPSLLRSCQSPACYTYQPHAQNVESKKPKGEKLSYGQVKKLHKMQLAAATLQGNIQPRRNQVGPNDVAALLAAKAKSNAVTMFNGAKTPARMHDHQVRGPAQAGGDMHLTDLDVGGESQPIVSLGPAATLFSYSPPVHRFAIAPLCLPSIRRSSEPE